MISPEKTTSLHEKMTVFAWILNGFEFVKNLRLVNIRLHEEKDTKIKKKRVKL